MESHMKTYRTILAAVALAALAATASMAQHGEGKAAPKSGGGSASHEGPAADGTGKTGAAAHGGIDLVRPDGGYASLRRRATRSSLVANGPKKSPAIVPLGNAVAHPPALPPGTPAEQARNAIGVAAPTSTGIQSPGIAHPVSGAAVVGSVAKSSIGADLGDVRHETPHPVPVVAVPNHSTGLNGTAMGHPTTSAATLGGPSHIVSGIGGGNVRLKH
jgi:hypothetical protein